MTSANKHSFEKISSEELSTISGGRTATIYKKGSYWYVWNPDGKLVEKFRGEESALHCAGKESANYEGDVSGNIKILKKKEYEKMRGKELEAIII